MKTVNKTSVFIILSAISLFSSTARAYDYQTYADIRFVKIDAGCFMMGGDADLKSSSEVELPQHRVCIDKPFYLGETEVTQKQWEAVMGSNPSKFPSLYKPVEKVSWVDVQEFFKRLNAQEKTTVYRLPTEAEWEYAAKAGSTTMYSFGDKEKALNEYAWYGNEGYGGSSHEVAKKLPNPWGLYDMHGNVWEWVQDWYDPRYYQVSPANDPKGADAGQYRVYRGGSWVSKAGNLRSSLRYSGLPVSRSGDIGFRVLREIE